MSIELLYTDRKEIYTPMKITCLKSDLLNGVQIVSKAVPSKTTMPILECILIDCQTGIIKMTANDMELGIETIIQGDIEEKGIKNGQGLWPLRTAVSGKQNTPCGAFEMMNILGKEETLSRIKKGIELLSKEIG